MCCIKCDPPLSTTWYDEEWSQRYNWKSWSNSDSLWNEEKIHRKGATTLIWSCILLCLYDANQSVYGNFIASLQFPKRRRLALHPVILKGDRFWLGDLLESCAFCPCYLSLSLYQHAWQRDHVVKVTSIHKCFLLFQLGRLLPCNFLKVSRHKHHIIKWQLWICLQMEPKSCCDNSALPLPGGVMLKGKSRLSAQQKLSKLNPAQKLGFWNHIQSHKILVPQKNANLGEVLGCASHGNRGSNVTLNQKKMVARSSARRSVNQRKVCSYTKGQRTVIPVKVRSSVRWPTMNLALGGGGATRKVDAEEAEAWHFLMLLRQLVRWLACWG